MYGDSSNYKFNDNVIIPGLLVKTKFSKDDEWITNIIESVNGDTITIPLVEFYFKQHTLDQDTMIIEFVDNEHQYKIDGQILNIDISNTQTMSIKVSNFSTFKNKRKSVRHYINLGASIKTPIEDNLMAIITNISKTGICFVTKWDLNIGAQVTLDVLLSLNNIVSFSGKIVRIKTVPLGFEHAIALDNTSKDKKNISIILRKIEEDTVKLRDNLYQKFNIFLKRKSKSFFNLKILLVDNSHLVRTILKNAINNAGITSVYEVSDSFEALDKIKRLKPDIVALSQIIFEVENKCIIEKIMAQNPEIKIVILSSSQNEKPSAKLVEVLKRYNIDFIPNSFNCDKLIEIIKDY